MFEIIYNLERSWCMHEWSICSRYHPLISGKMRWKSPESNTTFPLNGRRFLARSCIIRSETMVQMCRPITNLLQVIRCTFTQFSIKMAQQENCRSRDSKQGIRMLNVEWTVFPPNRSWAPKSDETTGIALLSCIWIKPWIDFVMNVFPVLLGECNRSNWEGDEKVGKTGEMEETGLQGEEKGELDVEKFSMMGSCSCW